MYTTEYKIASNGCHDSQSHVRHLEHVQLEVVLSCSNISNIVINLVSPMKTRVGLLTKISLVKYGKTVYHKLKWTFMAVQFWGEDPVGEWMVELIAKGIDVGKGCQFKTFIPLSSAKQFVLMILQDNKG